MSRGTLDTDLSLKDFAYGAFTLSRWSFQGHSAIRKESISRSEPRNARIPVWALPRSLAATYGITVVFFSSGYLDVSVHRVPFHTLWIGVWIHEVAHVGFPIQISADQWIFAPPRSFSQLITSFIGS